MVAFGYEGVEVDGWDEEFGGGMTGGCGGLVCIWMRIISG